MTIAAICAYLCSAQEGIYWDTYNLAFHPLYIIGGELSGTYTIWSIMLLKCRLYNQKCSLYTLLVYELSYTLHNVKAEFIQALNIVHWFV